MNNDNYAVNPAVTESSLLRRIEVFLEDGDFAKADEYCERVLDINVENGTAYLYKLLSKHGFQSKAQLFDLPDSFDEDPLYAKIMRFGSDELKKEVSDINASVIARNEETKRRGEYEKALVFLESDIISELTKAKVILESLGDYENSKELVEKCKKKCEEIYDNSYNELYSLIKESEQAIKSIEYENSASLLERDGYDEYIKESRDKKIFDYSKVVSLCFFIVGVLVIVFMCSSFFDTAEVTFRTVLRCIITRILPGIPLTVIATWLSYATSKKIIKKQKKDLLTDIGTAAARAKEIGDKVSENEGEAEILKREQKLNVEKLRQLNSAYDDFCGENVKV